MTADEAIAEVKQRAAHGVRYPFIESLVPVDEILVAEIERLRIENAHLHDLIGGRS